MVLTRGTHWTSLTLNLRKKKVTKDVVPKKGLEPPHPCGYMDLNHARLPIPPLRRVTCGSPRPLPTRCRKNNPSILQGLPTLSNARHHHDDVQSENTRDPTMS